MHHFSWASATSSSFTPKRTWQQIFLDEIEAIIPWDDFRTFMRPAYHQPSTKGGRPPFPLEVMLRIHLRQQWVTLPDPLMEEMLFDTPCFRRFAGIDMVWERISNETTALSDRHLLAQHGNGEQIFEVAKQMLNEQGLLAEGTIVEGTIILAPSSTSTRAKPECAEGDRTKGVNGTRRCIRWPRATSGFSECATISGLMQPQAWSTPSSAQPPMSMN